MPGCGPLQGDGSSPGGDGRGARVSPPDAPGTRVDRRFRRADRVRLHREFDHVYQRGRRVAGRYALLHAVPNGLGRPRLGTTVGRRVGGAVVRNRVKRWIRETFRLHKAVFPPGHDVVIQARAGAAGATHEELEREILALAARFLERWPA